MPKNLYYSHINTMLSYVTNESKNKEFFGALLLKNSNWKCSYKITRTRPYQTEAALPACIHICRTRGKLYQTGFSLIHNALSWNFLGILGQRQ